MMISPLSLTSFCDYAYAEAYACHGELDLELPLYARRLTEISNHRLPPPAAPSDVATFLSSLHTSDLYLAIACGRRSEQAWLRFARLYQVPLREVTRRLCSSRSLADEIAESAMGHVYMPDGSGRSRIASFDGRSSLSFWLTVIVKRLAIREQQRRHNQMGDLTEYLDVTDQQSCGRLETQVRKERYQDLIRESLAQMTDGLSPRELLILQLRYLRGLKASEIADLLEVHRSSVTRQLERTHAKLKETILTRLRTLRSLSTAAIEECLVEMTEDPEYASLALGTLV